MAMDDSAEGGSAIFEATVFLSYFDDLPDTRQPGQGRVSA
jgi:hypothetical protein